jgi:hypothetical protein
MPVGAGCGAPAHAVFLYNPLALTAGFARAAAVSGFPYIYSK